MGRFKCFGEYVSLNMPSDNTLFTHADPINLEFLWVTLVEKALVKKLFDCDYVKYQKDASVKNILNTLFGSEFLRYVEFNDTQKYTKDEIQKFNSIVCSSFKDSKFLLEPNLDTTYLKMDEDIICSINGGPATIEMTEGTNVRMTAFNDQGILHSTN